MKVYIAELERFGYTLTCVGRSEEECRKAIMKEYTRAYKARNDGLAPGKCNSRSYSDMSDYATAKEEVYVYEMTIGKVEWR